MSDPIIIIKQTQYWLDSFIIKHNICPFAKQERDRNSIRFHVDTNTEISATLENLTWQFNYLNQNPETATCLFILEKITPDFEQFLDFVDIAEQLLSLLKYEGIYQLATFHPQYCFSGSTDIDPANYTNRSPYPMLHILRENSLTKTLQQYPNPENIPKRNIKYCQDMGIEKIQQLFNDCKNNFNK